MMSWRTWRVSNEAKCRMQNAKCKNAPPRRSNFAFCILHFAFHARPRMTEYAPTNELELAQTWAPAKGLFGWLMETGHKEIGMRYIVTAMCFFAAAGIEAALMRMQLSQPNNTLLSPDRY